MLYSINYKGEGDPASAGKKKLRKTTLAGGARIDLERVAKEQQIKHREEMEKILAAVKTKHEGGQLRGGKTLSTDGEDGEMTAVNGLSENAGAVKGEADAAKARVPSEPAGSKGRANISNTRGGGTVSKSDASGCVAKTVRADEGQESVKHIQAGQVDFDKVTGKVDLCPTMHFHHQRSVHLQTKH